MSIAYLRPNSNMSVKDDSGFGVRVRSRRLELGLNQVDLARLIGITQSSLSQIETGRTQQAKGMNLVQLARHLKTTTKWLMTGAGSHEESAYLTDMEEELLQIFHDLTDDRRIALIAAARAWRRIQTPDDDPSSKS